MDGNTAAAAVSAVVATSIALVVTELRKVHNIKAHQADVLDAEQRGHVRGWFEGRESILQQFQQSATPRDIVDR
jgi:hypothetical protein